MLTKQHYFASKITHPLTKQVYRLHMCGLCHALGDDYGLPYRLLTSHEMIMLNLLVNAQQKEAPTSVLRRCPLNPTRFVQTNSNQASTYSAAVSVALANASVQDDVADSGSILARTLSLALKVPLHTARQQLSDEIVEQFDSLTIAQTKAESDTESDPTAPTARLSALLFAATAKLCGQPANEPY
jgi:hypothetical protein